ncbi:unnamed protein product, partial [Effrenium voratum]
PGAGGRPGAGSRQSGGASQGAQAPKPKPRPPSAPPPQRLLERAKASQPQACVPTQDDLGPEVEAFLETLAANEEASVALRGAPIEVKRKMLQEQVPSGRSASAVITFRVRRYTRLLKAESEAARKLSLPGMAGA